MSAESVEKMENLAVGSELSQYNSNNYYELYMLNDHKTEMYVKFAKVLLIYQGSYNEKKKNEIAQNLEKKFWTTVRIISDKTFTKETGIICQYDKTEDYHDYFKEQTLRAMEDGNNLIVIDATVSNFVQNKYYFSLAHKFQYVTLIISPTVEGKECFWPKNSMAWHYKTNVGKFNEALRVNSFCHLFCGWFLHDVDSQDLRNLAALYASDCLMGCESFSSIYNKHDICTGEDFKAYYNMDNIRQSLAFCVVKVFNDKHSTKAYFEREEVKAEYGKIRELVIVGFVISPSMVAARVKLLYNQKTLWDIDDNDDSTRQLFPFALREESLESNFQDFDIQLTRSKSNTTLIDADYTVHEPLDCIAPRTKGKSCHIVLGRSQNANANDIDRGVTMALNAEQLSKSSDAEDLDHCLVRKAGKYWLIYMKKHYKIKGLFASYVEPSASNAIIQDCRSNAFDQSHKRN